MFSLLLKCKITPNKKPKLNEIHKLIIFLQIELHRVSCSNAEQSINVLEEFQLTQTKHNSRYKSEIIRKKLTNFEIFSPKPMDHY